MQPTTTENYTIHHAIVRRGIDVIEEHIVIRVIRVENSIGGVRVSGEFRGYLGGDERKRGRLAMQSDLVIELESGERFKMTVTNTATGAVILYPAD